MISILIILSFILEASFTNLVKMNSLFIPLFLLTSIVVLYPYFKSKQNFILIAIICGFFYDIIFSNSLFVSTISFGICSLLIVLFNNYMHYNLLNCSFINVVTVIIYRLVSYILLLLIEYVKFDYMALLESIYSSLIINIIYGFILYGIAKLIIKSD